MIVSPPYEPCGEAQASGSPPEVDALVGKLVSQTSNQQCILLYVVHCDVLGNNIRRILVLSLG